MLFALIVSYFRYQKYVAVKLYTKLLENKTSQQHIRTAQKETLCHRKAFVIILSKILSPSLNTHALAKSTKIHRK